MPATAVLIASLLTAPVADLEKHRLYNRIPMVHTEHRRAALARLNLVISPDGEMERCESQLIAGSPELAEIFCDMQPKSLWLPAKDPDGQPLYGTISIGFKVIAGSSDRAIKNAEEPGDAILDLPAGVKWETEGNVMRVSVLVEEDGAVGGCAQYLEVLPRPEAETTAMESAACAAVAGKTFPALQTKAGEIRRYVTTQYVKFRPPA